METVEVGKEHVRKEVLAQRRALTDAERIQKSLCINQQLFAQPWYDNAKRILFYYPIKNEVDVLPLLKKTLRTKEVFLPFIKNDGKMGATRINGIKELKKGLYGILEPKRGKNHIDFIDLVLVPGVAFDEKGNRFGFGKGYYDIFLKDLAVKKIGIAYDFQVLSQLSTEPHDVRMDFIVTEERVIG